MLNLTCDLCYQRKRRCDGLATRRCSLCVAKNKAECHYRPRRPPSQTSTSTSRHPASSSSADTRNPGQADDGGAVKRKGQSFWRSDSDAAAATLSGGGGLPAAASSGRSDSNSGREPGLLPLKRGRFSASPATGLIGLQENQFLGYFFDCLGFLALTPQSTIRDAMVRIMIGGGLPPNPDQRHRPIGAPSPVNNEIFGEGFDNARQTAFAEIKTSNDGGSCYWTDALAAESRDRVLPRDPSTCILWCAIALGALVRGHPLAEVGRYAGLAEDSLRACRNDATTDMARAYVTMAMLHDFLGDRVTTHDYLQLANSIVDELPPGNTPRGFHGLLQYAGMTRTLDTGLASAEDIKGYWESADPVWELSESVGEGDVSCLVLSVSLLMYQPLFMETGANRATLAEEPPPVLPPPPPPPLPIVKPVAARSFIEKAGEQDAELTTVRGRGSDDTPSEEVQRSVLPEMLRVQECFESSHMHLGIGGLLYYGNLAYLQLLNDMESGTSFMRAIDVFLRYPGLCRYKPWLWIIHSYLFLLAFTTRRSKYEEMRASYNLVLPPGSKPAPPFEECRETTDICDHVHCTKSMMHMMDILAAKRPALKHPPP